MATKQYNSRIQWKKDTASNWTNNNPVLLNGEIAIVVTNANETRFKIGDGTSSFTALPYQDEAVRALITAVQNEVDTKITNPSGGAIGQILTKTNTGVEWADASPPSTSAFNSKYNGTLPTSGWVSSGGQYYYQVTISDMVSSSEPLAIPQWTNNKTNEKSAWSTLTDVESFNGYVRFYAPSPIATAVPYTLLYTNYDSSVITLVNRAEGTEVTGTFIPA